MAEEEQHHHHFFHHKKDQEDGPVDYCKEEKKHKNLELLGELGAVAAGAYALVINESSSSCRFSFCFN